MNNAYNRVCKQFFKKNLRCFTDFLKKKTAWKINKRDSDPYHRNPTLTTGSLTFNDRKIQILWVEEGSIGGGGGVEGTLVYMAYVS